MRRRIRRAPNFAQFIITGALIGVIAGLVTGAQGESGAYSDATAMGMFAVLFGGIGALLFAGLAVVLDRRAARYDEREDARDRDRRTPRAERSSRDVQD